MFQRKIKKIVLSKMSFVIRKFYQPDKGSLKEDPSFKKVSKYLDHKFKFWKDKSLSGDMERISEWIYYHTTLPDHMKELLMFRYTHLIEKMKSKYMVFSKLNAMTKIFTSITSLVTTSLLSFNGTFSGRQDISETLWWITWSCSLAISVCNVFSTYYKIDSKHALFNKVYYKLNQEIWLYLSLIHPYNEFQDPYEENSHVAQFQLLMTRLETISSTVSDTLVQLDDSKQAISGISQKIHGKPEESKDGLGITLKSNAKMRNRDYDEESQYGTTI